MLVGHWLFAVLCSAAQSIYAERRTAINQHNKRDDRHKSSSSNDYSSTWNKTIGLENVMLEDEASVSGSYEERLVIRGQKVVLDCRADENELQNSRLSDSHERIRWDHNNNEISADLRISWPSSGRLEISHAVSADSGIWRCIRGGRSGSPIRLIVTIPPERPFLVYGGAQLAPGARLTTRGGNSLTLHCVVEGGNPAPSISWFLDDEDVTRNSKVRSEWRGAEDQFATLSNITITQVSKANHNSTITCVVSHPALTKAVPVPLRLNIEYSPDFRLRRWPTWGSPLREGASVSLLCVVDANPPSNPTWIKETEEGQKEITATNGWLNLTRVTNLDRGWYKCNTIHAFGHFSSHSIFINVLHGGREGVSSKNALKLRKVTYSDAGVYRCTTAMEDDTAIESENIQVVITGAPVVTAKNSTVYPIAGGPVILSALVCSKPTANDVTWLPPARQLPLRPGEVRGRFTAHNLTDTAGVGSECQNAVLSIKQLAESDTGFWVLVATNEKGAYAALIVLNVTSAAHSVAAATAGATLASGLTLPSLAVIMMLVMCRSNTSVDVLVGLLMPIFLLCTFSSRGLPWQL